MPPDVKQLIFDHVVSHPHCTMNDIRDALGISSKKASLALTRLKISGVLVGRKLDGTRLQSWSVPEIDRQRVITVSEWEGHPRDDWHQLFYGSAT